MKEKWFKTTTKLGAETEEVYLDQARYTPPPTAGVPYYPWMDEVWIFESDEDVLLERLLDTNEAWDYWDDIVDEYDIDEDEE